MQGTTSSTRIYVASLSDYNAGRLHGVWIDAQQEPEQIWEQINTMLAASPEFRAFPQGGPAEEWAIHDYEGFGPWSLSEWESINAVALVAQGIAEHGEAFAAWISNDSSIVNDPTPDYEDMEESFRESYRGCWESERDYAYERIEDLGLPGIGLSTVNVQTGPYGQTKEVNLVDELSGYLDWDALTQYVMEGCWTWKDSNYDIHIFEEV